MNDWSLPKRWARRSGKPRFPYPWIGAALAAVFAVLLYLSAAGSEPQPEPQDEPRVETAKRPEPVPTPVPEPRIPEEAPTPAAEECPEGCAVPPPGCSIKGNISKEGERIYHLPHQNFYGKTIISPEKGEMWFCTEEEAVDNGWRRAKV